MNTHVLPDNTKKTVLGYVDQSAPTTKHIACELHDYIEIACLYSYQVKLNLKHGAIVEGQAVNTLTTSDKREYLLVDNNPQQRIELNQIAKMTILTIKARFKEINF